MIETTVAGILVLWCGLNSHHVTFCNSGDRINRAAFKIVAARLAARGAFKIVAASIEAKS